MTREEARKHLIDWVSYVENPNSIPDFDQPCSADEIIESMKIGAEALSKIELPEGLEEAAHNFAIHYDNGTCDGIVQDGFKAGAEWMAQQGETIFDTIDIDGKGQRWLTDNLLQGDYDCGEEVIVQIRKK